jgi:hypothetical protein
MNSSITPGAIDHLGHRFACFESSNVFEKNQSGCFQSLLACDRSGASLLGDANIARRRRSLAIDRTACP